MTIRGRLLLLVFAVWLPAVAAFALLARATYVQEVQASRLRIQEAARSLALLVDREIDKRGAIARTLGASGALADSDLARFHAEATAATQGTGGWAMLVSPTSQFVNTRVPFGTPLPPPPTGVSPRPASGTQISDLLIGPLTGRPVLSVLAPELGHQPPRYNVGIAFEPAVIQAIVEQQPLQKESIAAVLDRSQSVVARSRDPQKWLGSKATPDIAALAASGQDGYVESRTLDGVTTLAFLARSSRYGWTYVVGIPVSALSDHASIATSQAFAAAGILLIIGLGLALYVARSIAGPVLALKGAADELGREAVPAAIHTGLSEADEVGAALNAAGQRSADATNTLERKVAEAVRDAEIAQARLLDGQKHEAIGRLTGGLAHDFNNLLQTISMGLSVLERHTTDEMGRRMLDASSRATRKATGLVRQMLSFSRGQPLKPQAVDLGDFLLRSQELIGKAVGSRLRLQAQIEPDLPPVFVDPTQMELAILNLIFNSRDAMPGGGVVFIRGRRDPTRSGFVSLEVEDSGEGIGADALAKVFEPYFTTKPVGSGSGLGLAQVAAFAKQSGGTVGIRSQVGVGTSVSILLPIAHGPVTAETEEQPPAPVSRPLSILFVEDDPLVTSVVVPALLGAGHRVRPCGSADDAVEILAGGEPFDLVFTDVVMPGQRNGMDLVKWCRAHRPEVALLVATGYTADRLDDRTQVLRKPYALDALLEAIQVAATAPQKT